MVSNIESVSIWFIVYIICLLCLHTATNYYYSQDCIGTYLVPTVIILL